MTGLFITFEGGEGSGKTTQIHLLHKALVAAGKQCLLTREPGGGPGAEAIRQLLLTGAGDKWDPVAETLLFQAARLSHVEQVIKPALAEGKIVLCDRFLDSTIVYQGIARGLGSEYIRQLHRLTLGNFAPDVTVLLDIDPAVGLKRAAERSGDETRFESLNMAFHRRVHEGFLALAKYEPERIAVIDAAHMAEEVHKNIRRTLGKHLNLSTFG